MSPSSDQCVESHLEVAKAHFLLQSQIVAQRNWFKRYAWSQNPRMRVVERRQLIRLTQAGWAHVIFRRMLMRGDQFVLHSGSRSRLSKVRKAQSARKETKNQPATPPLF